MNTTPAPPKCSNDARSATGHFEDPSKTIRKKAFHFRGAGGAGLCGSVGEQPSTSGSGLSRGLAFSQTSGPATYN
jgi:hypothetical protein